MGMFPLDLRNKSGQDGNVGVDGSNSRSLAKPRKNWNGNQCMRGAAPSNPESLLDWDWFSWETEGIQESGAGEAMDNNSFWNS